MFPDYSYLLNNDKQIWDQHFSDTDIFALLIPVLLPS